MTLDDYTQPSANDFIVALVAVDSIVYTMHGLRSGSCLSLSFVSAPLAEPVKL